MDCKSIEKVIRDWFNVNEVGTLHLPDGWYGRPHDNQHELTNLTISENAVSIELNPVVYLKFVNLKSVFLDGRDLVFAGFSSATFTRPSPSNRFTEESTYEEGEVKIFRVPWFGD